MSSTRRTLPSSTCHWWPRTRTRPPISRGQCTATRWRCGWPAASSPAPSTARSGSDRSGCMRQTCMSAAHSPAAATNLSDAGSSLEMLSLACTAFIMLKTSRRKYTERLLRELSAGGPQVGGCPGGASGAGGAGHRPARRTRRLQLWPHVRCCVRHTACPCMMLGVCFDRLARSLTCCQCCCWRAHLFFVAPCSDSRQSSVVALWLSLCSQQLIASDCASLHLA